MSTLNNLKLTAEKKPQHIAPVQQRRNKLSHRLWEQIQLAKSQVEGTSFKVTKYKSFKDQETGINKQIEVPKRIRPWWFVAANGKVDFPRFSRQLIMSEITKRKINERHQIYRRV